MGYSPATGWNVRLDGAVPGLLYGLRLSCSVVLALYVAFYLELDNPFWAGTSASIVCQPILGSSLRKGLFRLFGTVTGATVTVVASGLFPQDRVGFLVFLGFWAGLCSFGSTLARNFSSYGFALAGYTMAIIASSSIDAPAHAFELALTRATEIIIGIVSATLVMGITDRRRSRDRLADGLEALIREILERFSDLLENPSSQIGRGFVKRRALIARVAALDPVIDQAAGEDAELRRRVGILRFATFGLFDALSGWRIAESHLSQIDAVDVSDHTRLIGARMSSIGPDPLLCLLRMARSAEAPESSAARIWDTSVSGSEPEGGDLAFDVSAMILGNAASQVISGLSHAANGLALLSNPAAAVDPERRLRFTVADYLPATLNAVRTFVAVEAALAFWILSEWPTGLTAVTWVTITVMLLAPQQERASRAAFGFALGSALTACLGILCKFVVLPNREGFASFALVLAGFLTPISALSASPAFAPVMVAATINFIPILSPTNQIVYDTEALYNTAFAIVSGCLGGALALALIPPVPRDDRAIRLFALSLRDLRAMAARRWIPSPDEWQQRIYNRLIAMPAGVELSHNTRIVSLLTVGLQILQIEAVADGEVASVLRSGLTCLARADTPGLLSAFDDAEAAIRRMPTANSAIRVTASMRVIRDVINSNPSIYV